MQITGFLPTSGKRVDVVVPQFHVKRLDKTCFRGREVQLAGNFSLFRDALEFFEDSFIKREFLDEIERAFKKHDLRTIGVSIWHPDTLGWASTARLEDFAAEELEEFHPNRRSTALRVCTRNVYAPRTRWCTIISHLKVKPGQRPCVMVCSIYPGEDIGELEGDITKREGVVFFGWDHPGR